MTRIGFAYNQKPESPHRFGLAESAARRGDDEPPSMRRDAASRDFRSPASAKADARLAAPARPLDGDDRFAEWDSADTINAVAAALAHRGDVVMLEATLDFPERLRAASPDIVFNIAEGLNGVNRESHVPAICEFYDIPYSGSDPFTLSLCLDKARTKEILGIHGVATAPFAVATSVDDLAAIARGSSRVPAPTVGSPLFIKPVHEGSSKGITERNFVRTTDQLLAQGSALLTGYAQPVLVETFLPGAEFTCGVLGNGAAAIMLPIVAINFDSLPAGAVPIYGFEAKWIWDTPADPLEIFECPARIPDSLRQGIEDVVLRAYRVLGCRDWARVDVRLDVAGVPNVVEVNPLPGILPDPKDNSCLPKAARAAGIDYDTLIQRCLMHAAERSGVAFNTPTHPRRTLEGVA
ncbi:MAG TPA: hypothetical protein VMH39_04120 [Gemmatimonadaceae bacterium]|nr:hypothetical protein [Gemmatimonadaceae bacterium]